MYTAGHVYGFVCTKGSLWCWNTRYPWREKKKKHCWYASHEFLFSVWSLFMDGPVYTRILRRKAWTAIIVFSVISTTENKPGKEHPGWFDAKLILHPRVWTYCGGLLHRIGPYCFPWWFEFHYDTLSEACFYSIISCFHQFEVFKGLKRGNINRSWLFQFSKLTATVKVKVLKCLAEVRFCTGAKILPAHMVWIRPDVGIMYEFDQDEPPPPELIFNCTVTARTAVRPNDRWIRLHVVL